MGSSASRKFDPATDLVDLKGKVAIVTGGNAGIGFGTVQHLARGGAKVYLAARNEERATGAIARLREAGYAPGNGEVVWLKLDLSDPRDAKKAAEAFLKKEERLDILVNNAGILSGPFEKTSDGVSTMVVVNYISPFVFTRTLLPLLTETARKPDSDVRIVNLASITAKLTPSNVSFKTIEDFNVTGRGSLMPGLVRYGHSKFLDILWTKTLQKRLDAASPPIPITAIAIHPGGVDTFTHRWVFPRFFGWLVGLFVADVEHGAYTSVFAAAGKGVRERREVYGGMYLESKPVGRIARTRTDGRVEDERLGREMWETTERFLEGIGV
ncbi:hypothetical protein Hypma_003421 [Hypsizygus marmoreus]|uniref:NAD(P)-binding protein n=1 Tax=Hypsizygus marmoreus TaxID=39966 RepID=A0A369JB14_HYPMA|nr:hypothetical protein Hypma_003421 [Hypsizygus marmoreus]